MSDPSRHSSDSEEMEEHHHHSQFIDSPIYPNTEEYVPDQDMMLEETAQIPPRTYNTRLHRQKASSLEPDDTRLTNTSNSEFSQFPTTSTLALHNTTPTTSPTPSQNNMHVINMEDLTDEDEEDDIVFFKQTKANQSRLQIKTKQEPERLKGNEALSNETDNKTGVDNAEDEGSIDKAPNEVAQELHLKDHSGDYEVVNGANVVRHEPPSTSSTSALTSTSPHLDVQQNDNGKQNQQEHTMEIPTEIDQKKQNINLNEKNDSETETTVKKKLIEMDNFELHDVNELMDPDSKLQIDSDDLNKALMETAENIEEIEKAHKKSIMQHNDIDDKVKNLKKDQNNENNIFTSISKEQNLEDQNPLEIETFPNSEDFQPETNQDEKYDYLREQAKTKNVGLSKVSLSFVNLLHLNL